MLNLIEKAHKLGEKAFEKGLGQAPHSNPSLDLILPESNIKFEFHDVRIAMYNAYITGWHTACDKSLQQLAEV